MTERKSLARGGNQAAVGHLQSSASQNGPYSSDCAGQKINTGIA
jgi:hypothetical protein